MKKFLLLGLCLGALQLFANVNFWSSQQYRLSEPSGIRKIIPLVANKVVLDDVAFRTFQQQIPSEASGEFILMDMPMPDGNMRTFKVFERTCMASELAAKYPMIKTYQGIAMDNPAITAKFDYTLFGFHAMVFDEKGVYFIDPYTNQNTGLYNCYWKKDYVRQDGNYSSCQNDEHTINADYAQHLQQTQSRLADPTTTAIISDNKIRTFRLALACTIEYSAAVAGPSPTKPLVLSAMVTSINRVNGVFEKDLSIHMNLVPNNDTLIFITSDSYTNNNGGTMLGQNVTVCNARIGSANYDIGHVFSTGGGGVAYLGCICTADKARGVTGSSNPVGDGYDIDYVAHEMGHQYGADHTFNSITGSCSGNRASNAAYEPGSATTIMGYAGICGSDNIQPHSDDYFHRISISQIFTYISSTSCAVITTNGNTAPVVNTYTATYYVPYKTSFEFATSATDANGDPLTYCWEEWDLGGAAAWNATTATAPIFRSFNPTSTGYRVFPRWDSLIRNSIKYKGEVLPEVTRDVKFRCTVRDMHNGFGAFNAPDINFTVKAQSTSTLFRVTSFPTLTTLTGNTTQIINWDVAGTTASPISCANVDIYLSLDSARTFPYLLASATANDGSETVTIPNVVTANASARIKVKGNGNIFFDLNDGWIKINQGVVPFLAQFTASDSIICAGNSITFTNTSSGSPDSVRWTINGGTPSTSSSSTTVSSVFSTAGSYTITLTAFKAGNSSTISKTITVNPNKIYQFSQTICQGQSVTIGSQTFNASGNYNVHLQTSQGCDSSVYLTLTVNPTKTTQLNVAICEGESYTVGNQLYNTAGTYVINLLTSTGCDSVVTLMLTVNPKPQIIFNPTAPVICQGDSVTLTANYIPGATCVWSNGQQTFNITVAPTVSTYYTVTVTNLGCTTVDSVLVTVHPAKITQISQTICQGQSVTIGNQTFTTSGNYNVHLQTSHGCDSSVYLSLTVNPNVVTQFSQTICQGQSITIGNQTFTTSGNYNVHLQTSQGCDSSVYLSLTVNPNAITQISKTICQGQSVTIGNQTFTTSGNYNVHLQSSQGCDSSVYLSLTVQPLLTTSPVLSIRNDSLVTDFTGYSEYKWYLNGVYQTTTTIPTFKPILSGNWQVFVTIGACVYQSNVFALTGIKSKQMEADIRFFPNPNNGLFTIQANINKAEVYEISVFNVAGEWMHAETWSVHTGLNEKKVDISQLAKGAYFIRIQSEDGTLTKNIIIQ